MGGDNPLRPSPATPADGRPFPKAATVRVDGGPSSSPRLQSAAVGAAVPVPVECACRPDPRQLPVPLLGTVVEENRTSPRLMVVSAGFERGEWRAGTLATHVLDWVEDFAMRPADRALLGNGQTLPTFRRAMRATFGDRADTSAAGEVLLHAVCRQFFGSSTVIHKIYFKTAANDQVKGYDAVHVVHTETGELELWLGEAKFYKEVRKAITAALDDLRKHFTVDYVRSEFAVVTDRIDPGHPHVEELRRLMDPTTSIEDVFDRVVVPVLVTYNSDATVNHDHDCAQYRSDVETEAVKALGQLNDGISGIETGTGVKLPADIRLILLPMATKADLEAALTEQLRGWRTP